jgi:hypothetical protein
MRNIYGGSVYVDDSIRPKFQWQGVNQKFFHISANHKFHILWLVILDVKSEALCYVAVILDSQSEDVCSVVVISDSQSEDLCSWVVILDSQSKALCSVIVILDSQSKALSYVL